MVLVDSEMALEFTLRKISILSIVLATALASAECVNGSMKMKLTTGDGKRQIELTYPYIYEKSISYNKDLSARKMMKCLGNVRMYWSSKPSEFNLFLYGLPFRGSTIPQIKSQTWFNKVKQKVKAKNQKAIDELNDTLAQLVQVHQPDKVGFETHQNVSSNFGPSLVGRPAENKMSWDQAVSKLGLDSKSGIVEMTNLLTKTGKKIRIKYVEDSSEQICLAHQNTQIDLTGTNFLLHDFRSIDYDQEKNMPDPRLRSDIKEPYDGYVLTPPEFTSKLSPLRLNVQALIKKKYSQLIYYSGF